MDFKACYSRYTAVVEGLINEYFKEKNIPQRDIIDAMRYSISAGGKRLRPVLCMACAELLGSNLNDAVRVSLAIECIHTYSLIHDDMPCMDDDDLRRGRPTCHKVYGEAMALLAGDGLLNTAFEILSDTKRFEGVSTMRLMEIVHRLASASGVFGMIGGQVLDIKFEGKDTAELDELNFMHSSKTGALIRAAAVCGGLCAELASDEDIEKIDRFAEKIGLAFQIKDDILDVSGDELLLGKHTGGDKKCGKNTFVTLLGLEEAEKHLMDITEEAKKELKGFGDKGWFLADLADFLLMRKS